jgi:DNA-binding CsgD family transcriptional regulator
MSRVLLDREREKQELDRLLTAARQGMSGAIVLRGEAGIGKTALLDFATAAAGDMQVARILAIESEMEWGFAGVHQLLVPFMGRLHRLPVPQRRALTSALGLASDQPPDRFLVGLATLTLLSDAATEQPLLAVIDDAQWLDQESAAVLAFVARRLYADRVAMLFAVREPEERSVALEGLAELRVEGLPDADARTLLASVAAGELDEHIGERIVGEIRGNPLALVELGAELTPAELSGRSLLPEPLPVSRRLEERFLSRVRTLPADTQTLLLLASAEQLGDPELLWRAAEQLGVAPEAAEAPGVERLLRLTPQLSFHHPLMRSAVYQGASAPARRDAHEALAAAVDRNRDPDRRAWHLAAAAVGPDEEVAGELESAAARARARGGIAATAKFLTKAAELSPGDPERVRRLIAGAIAELAAGAPARALGLLERAHPIEAGSLDEGRALRLRGNLASALGQGAKAPSLLLQAARVLQPLDPALARATLLEAVEVAFWTGDIPSLEVTLTAEAIRRVPKDSATIPDLLLDGFMTMFLDGHEVAAPLLRRAVTRLRTEDLNDADALRWLGVGGRAARELLDDDACRALTERCIALARGQGALTLLPLVLDDLGRVDADCGRFDRAEAMLAEAREIERASGAPRGFGTMTTELCLRVYRGEEAQARETAVALMGTASEHHHTLASTFAHVQLCILNLGHGRYAEAYECARAAYAAPFILTEMHVFENLIEAASRVGQDATAAVALARLGERVRASGTRYALGLHARSRALVAVDGDPEPLYQEALVELSHCQEAIDLARTHLLYGEWLRRERRRRDARAQLETAHDMFESMGATAFAQRAQIELLATGGTARRRTPETSDDLTPQESQIALLASHGVPNAEIASQLFISPSTVAYHLRKVFRKLGVSNRVQLARAMPDRATSAGSAL